MFKKYRILEVNGEFIPQIRYFLFIYYGIESNNNYIYYEVKNQVEYCSKSTIQSAKAVIDNYIEKNKKPITKIHKY